MGVLEYAGVGMQCVKMTEKGNFCVFLLVIIFLVHQQEFSVDLYMGQFWRDPRLGFGLNQTIILSGDATNKLWVPDTFIINSIDTKIHKLVSINKKAWVHLANGTIMLVLR